MLVTTKSSGITVMRYFVTRFSQHCILETQKTTFFRKLRSLINKASYVTRILI